jgi:hypothetical protein
VGGSHRSFIFLERFLPEKIEDFTLIITQKEFIRFTNGQNLTVVKIYAFWEQRKALFGVTLMLVWLTIPL